MKYIKSFSEQINEKVFNHLSNNFFIVNDKYNQYAFYLYDNENDMIEDKTNFNRNKNIGFLEFENKNLSEYYWLEFNKKERFPLTENKWFLENIWVDKKYIGKELGFKFIIEVLKKLKINDFYLESTSSSYNRWIQLGEDTNYVYRGNPTCHLIHINKINQ
jgi:hypothetical protein